MTRRHREPQDVGKRTRVVVRDRPGEGGDLGGEHRLRRDDPVEEGEPAGVVAAGRTLEQVAVGQLASESDPDPASGHGRGGELVRDEIVEWAVEVRERDVDGDPGDRQLRGLCSHGRLARRPPPGWHNLRHGPVLPDAVHDPCAIGCCRGAGRRPVARGSGGRLTGAADASARLRNHPMRDSSDRRIISAASGPARAVVSFRPLQVGRRTE